MTLYIDVPFSEKDAAKAMGARWDNTRKLWFIPAALHQQDRGQLLLHFPIIEVDRPPGIPEVVTPDFAFPGENRQYCGYLNGNLYVDMVPSTCWFTNIRSAVAPHHWSAVRVAIIARAGNRCECCGSPPLPRKTEEGVKRGSLECHERWAFHEPSGVQTLKRLIALCSACHEATHYGLAEMQGRGPQAREHLMAVNRWTSAQVDAHIAVALALWERRSSRTWTLDIQIIERAGIATTGPTDGVSRAARAQEETRAVRNGR